MFKQDHVVFQLVSISYICQCKNSTYISPIYAGVQEVCKVRDVESQCDLIHSARVPIMKDADIQ